MRDAALNRRAFVGAAAAVPGAMLLSSPPRAAAARVPMLARGGAFAEGVSAGDATSTMATLWTRTTEVLSGELVHVEVATDPGFSRTVFAERVAIRTNEDATSRIDLTGLRPGTEYYYRFATRDTDSEVGRFRTLPPPDSQQPVRVAFWSCQQYSEGYFSAHAALAAEDVDAVVCLGDYIYETASNNPDRAQDVRSDTSGVDGDVQTLPEYRQKYQLYRSDPDLRPMHAAHAYLVEWDDHEIENDYAGNPDADPDMRLGKDGPVFRKGAPDGRRVTLAERAANGRRAFFEYHPMRRFASDPNRIYRSVRLGAHAELFMIDTRSYRDDQPCGDMIIIPCAELNEPRRLLGETQLNWLIDGMADSQATWKLPMSQTMWMGWDVAPGFAVHKDTVAGYNWERNRFLDAYTSRGITDSAFLSGDVHTFFAGEVYRDGRPGLFQRPVIPEFVGGSISALDYLMYAGHGLSAYMPNAPHLPDLPATDPAWRLLNPHLKYVNTRRRGYGIAEATRDELRVTFRSPSSVLAPGRPAETIAEFRVARGRPVVERTG